MNKIKIFSLIVILSLAAVANSQDKGKTKLSGDVFDSFGAVIAEALIVAKNKDEKAFATRSTANGTYELLLTPGVYSIQFKKPPFKPFVVEEFQVANVDRMRFDVSLICENCIPIEHTFSMSQDSSHSLSDMCLDLIDSYPLIEFGRTCRQT